MFKCLLRDIISEATLLPQQVLNPRNTLLQLHCNCYNPRIKFHPRVPPWVCSVHQLHLRCYSLPPAAPNKAFSPRCVPLFIFPKQLETWNHATFHATFQKTCPSNTYVTKVTLFPTSPFRFVERICQVSDPIQGGGGKWGGEVWQAQILVAPSNEDTTKVGAPTSDK